MNILELDSYNLADAVKFNDQLNPRIWQGQNMRPEVREKLLAIAEDFKEFLGIKDISVKDITVSGSNANYSYTPYSDIDLHLVVDLPEADANEVYRELFDAKKYQYNDQHDFKIGGYDVELYVENANQPPVSKGVYSVLNDDWINIPRKIRSSVDDDAVRSKYEDVKHRIEAAVNSKDQSAITRLAEKIKAMRQAGLDTHGELGPENLAYKMLRTQGYIQKLYDARNAAKDQALSLKERLRKKPGSVFTYGFKHEQAMPEVPVVEWETELPTDEEILKDFVDFCAKELKLKQMPVVKLRRDPEWSVRNRTFGRYIDDQHLLEVAWGQRHVMDVLRTVAHELTHKRQHEREQVPADAGETGSPYENEANARAGVLMRDYGRLHPEFFKAVPDDVNESASGYIPTKKQAKDPRYSMALTVDIKPGQVGKEANKLKLRTDRQGHPQIANPNGLFEELALQLEAFKRAEEDYSPDAPPGPETKPTMPKGTLRVDVSDMYDWYKLGKNISNLKGADKSQFGKGPPSTIISFGDEDTEHKYIKDLEKLGLDTTDIDPLDPSQPKGMRRQKTDPTYNVNESEELDEVRMSPTALKKFADSPAAKGIMVGFEAEMIVPDVNTGDDDREMEPDYDADERCRSIQQIIEFFEYDEYGYGLSEREAGKLQERLDEAYFEWQDEQMMRDFQEEAEDLIKKVLVDEGDWDLDNEIQKQLALIDDLSTDEMNAILQAGERAPKFTSSTEQTLYAKENPLYEKYLDAQEEAEGLLDELVQDSVREQDKYWDAAIDDFRDDYYVSDDSGFFDDVGLRYMSDVSNEYDIGWPYWNYSESEGSQDIDSVADSLSEYIGMPVKASYSYHGTARRPGEFIVEPDGSLEADSYSDGGLEIISPPMPIAQAMEKLNQVIEWAQAQGCYTNSSTGLHMGVSLPGQRSFAEAEGDAESSPATEKPIDFMKLALFLGDQHVLKEFEREANSYCRSSLEKLKEKRWSPTQIATAMEKMRGNLINLAYKDLADRSPGRDSINMKDNYVEFRGAGGDYLSKESDQGMDFLENTLLRYVQALAIAGDPTAYRDEYAKKLYKLLNPTGDDTLNLFSQFAAGEIDKEKLKTEWARKTLEKDDPSAVNKGEWVVISKSTGKPVQGQSYNGYTKQEVFDRAWSKLTPDMDQATFDAKYSIEPQNTGRWEVYSFNVDDDRPETEETLEIVDAENRGAAADAVFDKYNAQGIAFKVRPYYGDDVVKPAPTPRAKLAKQIIQKPPQPQQPPPDATEQEGTWQLVDVTLNRPVETFQGTWAQAERIAQQYETGPGEHNGHEISIRRAQ